MSDDSPLSPDDRAVLSLARDSDEPTAADRARIRSALVAQLGVGIGLGAAVTGATAAASAAETIAVGTTAATGFFGVKLIAVIAIVGSLGVGGALIARARAPVAPPPVPALAPDNATTASTRAAPAALPPAPAEFVPPSRASTSSSHDEATPTGTARSAHVPTRAAAEPSPSIEAETRLVGGGAAALRDGDPARALALFDEHARTFPAGVLAEERAAERVLALCALGRTLDARVDADRFLRDRPHSPLSARVRTSCAGDDGTPR